MADPLQQRMEEYAAGPRLLRDAVAGMSREELTARPVPGRWSALEVVCHIADFEPVYADRMKRCLAEDNPPLRGGEPEAFRSRLHYHARDLETELALVEIVRSHVLSILRQLEPSDFERTGLHSEDGPLTISELLRRITGHIPHHVKYIEAKRQALAAG